MKHTPAPWQVVGTNVYGNNLRALLPMNAADARLIAAAPVLLEALLAARFLIWHQYAEDTGPWHALLRRIDDAIATAKE